jgi:hypothetical protein
MKGRYRATQTMPGIQSSTDRTAGLATASPRSTILVSTVLRGGGAIADFKMGNVGWAESSSPTKDFPGVLLGLADSSQPTLKKSMVQTEVAGTVDIVCALFEDDRVRSHRVQDHQRVTA